MATLPYTPGSATSKAAAKSMVTPSCSQREAIWHYINSRGAYGATRREVQAAMRLDGPRLTELRRLGRIKAVGTRATKSNRKAEVFVAVDPKEWTDKRPGWPVPKRSQRSSKVSELKGALDRVREERDLWRERAFKMRDRYRAEKNQNRVGA